jgi:heat shock protein HslJ
MQGVRSCSVVSLILLVAASFAAPVAAQDVAAGVPFADQQLRLVEIDAQAIPTLSAATVTFGSDGVVKGNSGCLGFEAPYATDGQTIAIGPITSGAGKPACTSGDLEIEPSVLDGLSGATTWAVEGGRLTLAGEGSMALVFEGVEAPMADDDGPPVADSKLSASEWQLDSVGPGKAKGDIRAIFGPGGLLIGTTECYDYRGTYTAKGKKLKVKQVGMDVLSQTSCDMSTRGQADFFLNVLKDAKSWKVDKQGRLTITTGGRSKSIDPVFVALDPISPTGRGDAAVAAQPWRLTSLAGPGAGAIEFPPGATPEVTLQLGADGSVSGQAPCHAYRGSFLLLSATEMATSGIEADATDTCPKDMVDLEAVFLAILQTLEGYSLVDGQLALEGLLGSELVFEPLA